MASDATASPGPDRHGPQPPRAHGRLVLVRHGQTLWAATGRHTGRTDVPLTAAGEASARALPILLEGFTLDEVRTSPLARARETARLAGLTAVVDDRLTEWDYGGYEGLTAAQIRHRTGTAWSVFRDGVVPGATPGETLAQVADRARRVLDSVRPALARTDVALVAHGHLLRVLAAVYLGLDPQAGELLLLDPASVSVLEEDRDQPAIRRWNEVVPRGLTS